MVGLGRKADHQRVPVAVFLRYAKRLGVESGGTDNRVYVLSATLAHNLNRELQIIVHRPERRLNERRSPLWSFKKLGTLRRIIIQRAGRLTRPNGKLKLTMSANQATQDELLHILTALEQAA